MKKIFKVSALAFIFSLGLFVPKIAAETKLPPAEAGPAISMDFQDASLKDILKVFSIQSALNFIASEELQDRRITLFLDKVPLNKAMEKLFKANNLSYELDKEANIFIVKDLGKPAVETETRVFYLKHATVSSSSLKEEMANLKGATGGGAAELSGGGGGGSGKWAIEEDTGITKVVKKLLSESGSVIEDFRTNSLIVNDVPNRMAVIAQTIAALDIPVPQVILEVEMLDVAKNKIDRLGIKFTDAMTSSMFGAVVTGAAMSSAFPIPHSLFDNKNFAKTFTPGSVSFAQPTWKIFMDFIKQQADTRILARPRILTLNNETAEIKITSQEAIGTITTTQGQGTASTTTTSAERIETGVSLRVTPQINAQTGEITMFILPSVRDATASTFNTSYKDPEERSTRSVVRIKDGETVIIGGLIRNERSETVTKLPLLGDIPVLGKLFTHKYKDKDKERELLVFITSRIVKETDIKLVQAKRAALPQREQNAAAGFNRELAINSSLNTFSKKN